MLAGVPLKLIKEFLNRTITVETSSGDVFKGTLLDIEDNMNMTLNSIKATLVDGKTAEMASLYIKGSRIRIVALPESAMDSLPSLTRPSFRGRGGRGGGFRRGGGGRSSYDRRRY